MFNIQEDDVEGAAALPFENKVRYMHLFLQHKLKIPRERGVIKVKIRRDTLLEDAFNTVLQMGKDSFRRAFMYEFVGEEGLDYGALTSSSLLPFVFAHVNRVNVV